MKKKLFSQVQVYEFIKKHEPFNAMSDQCLLNVASVLEEHAHPGNSLLIKKGEKLNDLYILIKGRLYYQITNAEGHVNFQGEFYEGDLIGEMALISDLPRSADVYTLRDSIILKLTKNNFLELSQKYPELLNKITQFTIKRLTNSLQGINKERPHNKSIAMIPIHPIPHGAAYLNKIMNKFPYGEKILILTNDSMDKNKVLLDEEGNLSHEGILWIGQMENEYSFIFYLADDTLSNWTKFCIRQADSIALLAFATHTEYALSAIEHYINDNKQHFVKRTILMLLHRNANRPKSTQDWLQHRHVMNHYHVRIDTDAGISRMMRIFTDNTVSLVLSGGGARGLAHIGFYKLLEERNIPIDYIAGTSMGAMIAGFFAYGYSSDEVLEIANTFLIKSSKIDFTFPYIAISSGKRVSEGLHNVFADTLIENLWLNYFCVSTDLVSQNLFVHDKGLLWESVRSSLSLPFIYPPVSIGDKLLLDGGILNNIPIDVMRNYSCGNKIIASNITGYNTFKLSPFPSSLSGWKLLYNKLRGNEAILPLNLGELVLRLLTISSHQNTEKMLAMADQCVSLKIEQYSMLDFKRHKEIAELGYIQAKEQFKAQNLKELLNYNPQAEEQLKLASR